MKMMEEVEKLCDRLELTRYESVFSQRAAVAQEPPWPKERDAFWFLARL